ncbi:MAG: hypothetical protein ACI399_06160, partial [Candidatus Cryptobacteroides sp.]
MCKDKYKWPKRRKFGKSDKKSVKIFADKRKMPTFAIRFGRSASSLTILRDYNEVSVKLQD